MENKEKELLLKLYNVTQELNYEFCTLSSGQSSGITGVRYKQLSDTIAEVEKYLGLSNDNNKSTNNAIDIPF